MLSAVLVLVSAAPVFTQHATWNDRSLLFGAPIQRDGIHLQLVLGLGAGVRHEGLFHALEVGATLDNGVTLAVLQTAVQNKGVLGPDRGADLIGGWMFEIKVPVFFPELELNLAAGLGAVFDESRPALVVIPGFGWAYGSVSTALERVGQHAAGRVRGQRRHA